MNTTLSAVAVGALALAALTGCSADSTAQYCDASISLESKMDQFDDLDLGDDIFESAITGDLEPLHTWGDDVNALVADVEGDMATARDNAPNEEVKAAIDKFIELIDVMNQMGDAASDATDFEAFSATMVELGTEVQVAGAEIDAAGTLIDDTNAELCS